MVGMNAALVINTIFEPAGEPLLTEPGTQNPNFTANAFIAGLAPAIYMLVFGGVNATQVRRDWIDSFFRKSPS
jgi:hypothetical protein